MAMLSKRLLCALLVGPLVASCGLHKEALRLHRSRLELELASLHHLQRLLSGAFPPGENHVSVVLRWDAVNKLLAAADGLRVPIEEIEGATLNVQEIRTRGEHGAPLLAVVASASRGRASLGIEAIAMLVVDNAGAEGPVLRVRVTDIKPVFTWRCLRLADLRLANRLAHVEADKLALNRIAFPIPTSNEFAPEIPPQAMVWRQDTPRGNGSWIELELGRPGGRLDRRVILEPPVFLRDGVHLFGSISDERP